MEKVKKAFRQFNQYLDDADFEILMPGIELRQYKKGSCLLKKGQITTLIYFIEQGAIKCYSTRKEKIIWAEFEGNFVSIPYCLSKQVPTEEELYCLEDSSLYVIDYSELSKLYAINIRWANWGRHFMEHWIKVMELIYSIQTLKTATEKYNAVIALRPDILQRASLKDISSFLGISQVSASRIRANNQVKKINTGKK